MCAKNEATCTLSQTGWDSEIYSRAETPDIHQGLLTADHWLRPRALRVLGSPLPKRKGHSRFLPFPFLGRLSEETRPLEHFLRAEMLREIKVFPCRPSRERAEFQ